MFTIDAAEGATPFAELLGDAGDLVAPALDPATALVVAALLERHHRAPKGVMLSHRNLVANLLPDRSAASRSASDVR